MCIKREKKQHMKGVGEKQTYINNIEEKNINMNAIKHAIQPKIQTTF